jgi:MFS transporter, ACS family, D-galactonate transporter
LLLNATVVSTWCSQFAAYWASSLLLAWYPAFLVKGLGFDQTSIGFLAALPPAAVLVSVPFCGWISQRLLALGISSRISRGVLGGSCVVLGGLVLLTGAQLPSAALAIAATTVGIAVPSTIFVVSPAVIAEIVPAGQRGGMLAIGNAIATSAGLLAPYVTGHVIEGAETPLVGFERGFIICGVIMIVGGCMGMAFIRPERETARWRRNIREDVP